MPVPKTFPHRVTLKLLILAQKLLSSCSSLPVQPHFPLCLSMLSIRRPFGAASCSLDMKHHAFVHALCAILTLLSGEILPRIKARLKSRLYSEHRVEPTACSFVAPYFSAGFLLEHRVRYHTYFFTHFLLWTQTCARLLLYG